jgi:hypothetical protein
MDFFRKKTTWSNLEFIPLKLCIGSAYLIIGSYFHAFVQEYRWVFLAILAVTVAISLNMWIRKMRMENPQ